jgi:hypothetical protein
MRQSKRNKREWVKYLTSPIGTAPQPYLRRMRLRLPTRLSLLLTTRRMPEIAHLPSPPFVKVIALKRYARQYGLNILVETGTFMGSTTTAMADVMPTCITIELSPQLFERAVALFRNRSNVRCIHGNSGEALVEVLRSIDAPALFWLDAHHSGGITAGEGYDPILDEIKAIFAHPVARHCVVLVDDARGHQIDHIGSMIPATHAMTVRNDIIRIVPR